MEEIIAGIGPGRDRSPDPLAAFSPGLNRDLWAAVIGRTRERIGIAALPVAFATTALGQTTPEGDAAAEQSTLVRSEVPNPAPAATPTTTPAAAPAPAAASISMLVGGLLVWLWCGSMLWRHGHAATASRRLREHTADRPQTDGRPPIPGAVLVLCGLAVWLSQPMGAAMSLALLGTPATASATGTAPESPLRDSAAASLGAYAMGVALIVGVVVAIPGVWRAIGASVPPRSLGRALVQSAVWSVGAGLAVYLVGALSVWGAEIIATWRGTEGPGSVAHSTLSKLLAPSDPSAGAATFLGHDLWWWGTVLGVTVGAPIIEEFIYRGFIQTGLLRLTRSGPVAIVATSLMFALAHWSAVEGHALVTLFALSLCFGMALEKTGKLWVCVLMHAAFNAGNILMAMR